VLRREEPVVDAILTIQLRSFEELLVGLSDEELMDLLARRPSLLRGKPESFAALARNLCDPLLVAELYEGADAGVRALCEALVVADSPVEIEVLARLVGSEVPSIEPLLDRLGRLGLVRRPSPGTLEVNPGLAAMPEPPSLGPPGRPSFESQPMATLVEVAGRVGARTKGPKAALVTSLLSVLSDPVQVARLVERGPAGTEEVARRLASGRPALHLPYGMLYGGVSDDTPAGWLLGRGLLLAATWSSAVMPREVVIALRGGRVVENFSPNPPPLASTPVASAQVEAEAAEAALRLVADCAQLLEAWSTVPAKLLQAGGLGSRELKRAAKLLGTSPASVAYLAELAQVCHLISVYEGEVMPTSSYDDWLELDAARRWAWLAHGWLSAAVDLGLARSAGEEKPDRALSELAFDPDAPRRRAVVLSTLAGLAPDRGVVLASLYEHCLWLAPRLFQGARVGSPLFFTALLEETELLGVTARSSCSSFGRALLGDDGAIAAGEALGLLTPAVVNEVILQADLTAVVAGEPDTALRAELELLGERESVGSAWVFRFSEATLRRAFDAGRSASQILALLESRAARGVPQPLAYLIEDIGRRFGKLRTGAACAYLRSDDTSLLQEVVGAKRLSRLELRLLAPTVAVSPIAPGLVVSGLRDAGYLVASEGPDGTLALSRPPARRVPDGDEDRTYRSDLYDGDRDDLDLGEIIGLDEDDLGLFDSMAEDPTLAAAFAELTGVPRALLAELLASRPGQSANQTGQGSGWVAGPVDLRAFVSSLRSAPVSTRSSVRAPTRRTRPEPGRHSRG